MSEVFVAHSRDDRAAVEPIIRAMRVAGLSVWHPNKLPFGANFAARQQLALDKALCVVVIWSKAATASQWVQEGIKASIRAWSSNRLLLVALDDTPLPVGLRDLATTTLQGGSTDATENLVERARLIVRQRSNRDRSGDRVQLSNEGAGFEWGRNRDRAVGDYYKRQMLAHQREQLRSHENWARYSSLNKHSSPYSAPTYPMGHAASATSDRKGSPSRSILWLLGIVALIIVLVQFFSFFIIALVWIGGALHRSPNVTILFVFVFIAIFAGRVNILINIAAFISVIIVSVELFVLLWNKLELIWTVPDRSVWQANLPPINAAIIFVVAVIIFGALIGVFLARYYRSGRKSEPLRVLGQEQPARTSGVSQLFVSYSHQDGQVVHQLVQQIEDMGYGVWIDRQSTGAQQRYASLIVQAIRGSKLIALMSSRSAFPSDHVVREVYVAGDFKKPFIVFQLDETEFPDEVLYFVSGFPRIPISGLNAEQLRAEISRLVTGILSTAYSTP
jgi:hypothetical protein